MYSHVPRTVAEVLLTVGIQIQLSLHAVELHLNKDVVSTLPTLKELQAWSRHWVTLEGVEEDDESRSTALKMNKLVLKEEKIEAVTKANANYLLKMHNQQSQYSLVQIQF